MTILFDLDGTLLQMDQNLFIKKYLEALASSFTTKGYEPNELVKIVLTGTEEMIKNTGNCSNEEVFWKVFQKTYGEKSVQDRQDFDKFYQKEFKTLKKYCKENNVASDIVKTLKKAGHRLVIASNPVFPLTAQRERMAWAGLDYEDFDLITSYENSFHCKPNPQYYQDILTKLGVSADECLMIGNDVQEDMVAKTIGIKVFLVTTCLLNREEVDIEIYPHGELTNVLEYLQRFN